MSLTTAMDVGMGAGGFATALTIVGAVARKRIGAVLSRAILAFINSVVTDFEKRLNVRFNDHSEEIRRAKNAIYDVDSKVVRLNAIVTPNGGSSLADKVNNIAVDVAELKGAFNVVKESVGKQ